MSDLAVPVLRYIYDLTIKDRSPAYLKVSPDGTISDWGGNIGLYGIADPEKGIHISEKSSILDSFFPMDVAEPMFMPCLQTDSGVSADIHIFRDNSDCWILLLDATIREAEQAVMQQKSNELSLLRVKHAKILDQYLGKEITEKLLLLNIPDIGENKYVSVLFADICGFTPFSEQHSPSDVSRVLNTYLAYMIQPVLDEGGIVDKIIGDAVMGIFGVLPSDLSPSVQALNAAFRMMEDIATLKKEREAQKLVTFDISIGVATGSVFLGILGSRNRRTLTAIGHFVNLAARLESQARFNEILIDENTFRDAPDLRNRFYAIRINLKGIQNPVSVFSYGGTS